MLKVLFICLVLVVSGCKKPTCDQTKKYSNTAADRIGELFECKNTEAIALDLQSQVEKLNLCQEPLQTGMIAAVVCKPVSDYIASRIVKEGLPKRWKCEGGPGGKVLASTIYTACTALPF